MQLDAIYEDGRISLLEPLKLRHRRVRVTVQVPDIEVESMGVDDGLDEAARRLVATLDAIRREPPAEAADSQQSDPELAQRLDAFARRANR